VDKTTDWNDIWRQLVATAEAGHARREADSAAEDPWRGRARDFAERVRRKWARPDPIREFLAARVGPADTVLDIGAGTGSLAVPLARVAGRVTALDPSAAMREVLAETLRAEAVENVDIIAGAWPDAEVSPHDVTLCSHAMYGSPDLAAFVGRMVAATRRSCCLVMRLPRADGVMAEAARRVWGHPNDSPNFAVAYNVLLGMNIRPNVLVNPRPWEPWVSESLEAALADVKRRLGIADTSGHDALLRDLLARRLVPGDAGYTWPSGVHSALVYWDVER
jgi:SAM-dependent methyltransferase